MHGLHLKIPSCFDENSLELGDSKQSRVCGAFLSCHWMETHFVKFSTFSIGQEEINSQPSVNKTTLKLYDAITCFEM